MAVVLESMQIRIISTPPGEAPEHIRSAWIGLVLPTVVSGPRLIETIGVLSRPESPFGMVLARLLGRVRRSRGFIVEANKAIAILEEQTPEAAEWWRQNAAHLIQPGRCLLFHSEACEPVIP